MQKVCNELDRPTGSSATRPRPRRSSPRRRRPPGPARPRRRPASWPRKSLLEIGGAAGQAGRLPLDRPAQVRALHRRGRLGRRLGQVRPRLDVPGDPADPRQDHQRREGAHRPGAEEHRGPVADHRARHRHPRRVRPDQAALSQDRADGRRRRRRPAHPHAAADAAVPLHAAAGRGRPRLPGPAAAVQDQVGRQAATEYAYSDRERDGADPGRRRGRPQAAQGRRRSSATRASAR